jgi:glutamine amidotransferase
VKALTCTIVDYGMGNLGSVQNMLSRIWVESTITADPLAIEKAERLVLPGVGAFDAAMERLEDLGLKALLNHLVLDRRVPVLGICLGMQLMLEGSEEGSRSGFGWIPGRVCRLSPPQGSGLKVPHMGWNRIQRTKAGETRLPAEDARERFYFVHAYAAHCREPEHVLAQTEYGGCFDSVVGRDHILGCQFHPEKSHVFGMRLLSFILGPGRPC